MNEKNFKANSIIASVVLLLFGNLFFGFNPAQANSEKTESSSEVGEQSAAGKQMTAAVSKTLKPQTKKILWDFRKDSDSKTPNFSKAETNAVLKYLVGEERDQELGITSRLSGAFTKPNARETLYYVSGCKDENGKFVSNSTCGHVGWDSAGLIAVYDGTTPVMKIEQPLGYDIAKVTDLNGDGISEFLAFGGYAGMGIQTGGGGLGQISGGKYESIKDFGGYADNCGTDSKLKRAVASVISYIPRTGGRMPQFLEEYFETKCTGDRISNNPQWKKITKKEFDNFKDANS